MAPNIPRLQLLPLTEVPLQVDTIQTFTLISDFMFKIYIDYYACHVAHRFFDLDLDYILGAIYK